MGLSPAQAAGRLVSWLRDAAKAAASVADVFLPTPANAAVPEAAGESRVPQGSADASTLGGSPATGQFSPNAGDAAPESAETDAERWLAQARPPRTTRAELMARYPAATLREITQLEAEMSSGLAATSRVQRYNPDWQSPRSLYSTPNGEIRHWRAVRQQAEQDLRDIESSGPTPELVYPNGQIIGYVNRSATPDIRTVSPAEYQQLRQNLLNGARPIQNQRYGGSMFQRPDGFVFGLRQSKKHGETIDIWRREYPGFEQALMVHQQ
ncbi:MAG: hypothetical protein H6883_08100 [Rhodobiaceae bacterium]|nr:hypothetical protein [Rhodobiaceae bacterium]MCC0056084.1 hypothetical protein [Rhodobiaceae bacterium]